MLTPAAQRVLRHPLEFVQRVLAGFFRNQGLLLAGAIAYYALLSAVPLLILVVIAFSRVVEPQELLALLARYLEWLVPSQSRAVLADVEGVLHERAALGALLVATMLFFSSLAFSVLEKAMGVIFSHRGAAQARHALVSFLLPYCLVLVLGLALLALSAAAAAFEALAEGWLWVPGGQWSLAGVSAALLYLLGFVFEAALFAGLYRVLPAGGVKPSHALVGGVAAALLWEFLRRGLAWYFSHVSKVGVVYGSLTTAVVVLLSLEIAATVLLLGAQVIAEYEKLAPPPEGPLSGEAA
ncbi:MAG: YihY/virulence factor BrkB family protein [Azonexus sp.]|jgi:YihY family inner membrane protein|nr:YihY/virulence factor BrkB family protein [Betaproteobacteria bacterium]MBP6037638.1 YihY/virulence factor BrkB family protein [Azonexus sp.]MBP6907891.1 YihY/virulence factor BrkB family protein [Azonexus sp.]